MIQTDLTIIQIHFSLILCRRKNISHSLTFPLSNPGFHPWSWYTGIVYESGYFRLRGVDTDGFYPDPDSTFDKKPDLDLTFDKEYPESSPYLNAHFTFLFSTHSAVCSSLFAYFIIYTSAPDFDNSTVGLGV